MKIGTGWCGWTEQETDNTSMPVILQAYEGVMERIRFASGKPAPPPKPTALPKGTKASTNLIASMFGNK